MSGEREWRGGLNEAASFSVVAIWPRSLLLDSFQEIYILQSPRVFYLGKPTRLIKLKGYKHIRSY